MSGTIAGLTVLGQAVDVLAGERKKAERLMRAEDVVRRAIEALSVIGPIPQHIEAEQRREAAAIEHADAVVAAQAARAAEAVRLADQQIADRQAVLDDLDEQERQRRARLADLDGQVVAGDEKLRRVREALRAEVETQA